MLFLCPASGALWIWRWPEWEKKAWYFFSILPWVCVELECNSLTKWWRKWSFNVRQTGQKPQLYLRVCSCVDLIFCLQNTNWWWGISPFSSSWLKLSIQKRITGLTNHSERGLCWHDVWRHFYISMSPKQYVVICVRKGHLTLKSNLSVIHPSRLFSNSLPPASSREGRHQQLIYVCLQMALGLWCSKYWNAHSNLSFQKLWQICKPHSEHCYLANCQSRELYIQTSKGWCHWCLHPLIWSYTPALRENSERYTLWCHAIFALSKALCKGFRD